MSQLDNVERLKGAGFAIKTPLPEEYEAVIQGMSEEELGVLIALKERLDVAQASTEPHIGPYAFFMAPPF